MTVLDYIPQRTRPSINAARLGLVTTLVALAIMALAALSAPESTVAPDGWHGNSASARPL